MRSRLATEAREALIADLRRMTPEERLAAYVRHCQLMAQVRLAGKEDTRATPNRLASDAR
jgi:hypothetical protein